MYIYIYLRGRPPIGETSYWKTFVDGLNFSVLCPQVPYRKVLQNMTECSPIFCDVFPLAAELSHLFCNILSFWVLILSAFGDRLSRFGIPLWPFGGTWNVIFIHLRPVGTLFRTPRAYMWAHRCTGVDFTPILGCTGDPRVTRMARPMSPKHNK